MRNTAVVATVLLLIGSAAAVAAAPVQVVTADQKMNCQFIRFINVKSGPEAGGVDAALAEALARAARAGADSFYVMNRVANDAGPSSIDGQALRCAG